MPGAGTPAQALQAIVTAHGARGLLRFVTCGSVGDGKSTLIGRLLQEAGALHDDLDGLAAECQPAITIDVAYRRFTTVRRRYIVADTPGHEQSIRSLVTGVSTAELAVVLVDARKGLLPQTRHHNLLVSLLGIRHVVLAVNKMDLVDFRQQVFDDIAADYGVLTQSLALSQVTAIPVSGAHGDNVLSASVHMPWYRGPALAALQARWRRARCAPATACV